MRDMCGSAYLQLGLYPRAGSLSQSGSYGQFPHEGVVVFLALKYILRHYGGIPVKSGRKGGGSLTERIVADFKNRDYMNLAVTPEGTRSRQPEWHTGFLRIAYESKVPVQRGLIDFRRKKIVIDGEYVPTGDMKKDMKSIKAFYSGCEDAARYPDKFAM